MSTAVVAAGVGAAVMASAGGWLIYTSVVRAQAAGPDPPTRRALGSAAGSGRRIGRPRLRLDLRDRAVDGAAGSVGSARLVGSARSVGSPGSVGSVGPVTTGAEGVWSSEVVAAVVIVAAAGAGAAWLLFGGVVPAVFAAAFAGTFPVAAQRRRMQARIDSAVEEWPRLLEEIRLRTGSLGRSVPQALFEAGRSAPAGWQPVFEAAEREWLLTIDFGRTVAILKQGLSDPAADSVLETLLMAHEIGGTDLDSQLGELIEDRLIDRQSRRDAESRLAGVRFARRFVLVVPLGMALAGLTIGSGRQAYQTTGGQIAVVIALAAVAACWWWSGRLMRMPSRPRVFR
jgi:tight adherence protein B